MTEDRRSHSYRSEIRNTGLNRPTRSRRRLALSVPAVAGVRRVGALLLPLFVIGWLAAAAAPAAQARRNHAIKLTIVENQISTTNPNAAGPPPVGTITVRAGVASLTPGGRGADVDHVTVTSVSPATRSGTFKGTVTFFFLTGTLSGKSVGRVTLHADGSLTFSGATTLKSGTGAYKGVTGHLTFTGGSANKPGSVTTIHLTGTARY
ncbi:MAG: hypothetical protein JO342_05235 [Solirubrobacterales bacterium]|nr:hypothetical protein [Solirubrobacterales bacterium]MBV9165536.1 hypothetical protein [Solirubrobacterales bacterium]